MSFTRFMNRPFFDVECNVILLISNVILFKISAILIVQRQLFALH